MMMNIELLIWTLLIILIYGVFVWGIYDKNDKLVSFIAMIPPTLILIIVFVHDILAWNNFELMLKLMKN